MLTKRKVFRDNSRITEAVLFDADGLFFVYAVAPTKKLTDIGRWIADLRVSSPDRL